MPTPCKIYGCPNLADAATISWTGAVSGLPASNLQTVQPRQFARSTTLTDSDIELDLGAAHLVDGIWMVNHNLRATDTQALTLDNTSAAYPSPEATYGAAAVDEASIDTEVRAALQLSCGHYWATPVSIRYVRMRLQASGHPDGYLQAGRIFVGLGIDAYVDMGPKLGVKDMSKVVEGEDGSAWRWELPRLRSWKLGFKSRPRSEALGDLYSWLGIAKGIGGDLFVLPEPDDTGYYHLQSLYGRITGFDDMANKERRDLHSGGVEILEWR